MRTPTVCSRIIHLPRINVPPLLINRTPQSSACLPETASRICLPTTNLPPPGPPAPARQLRSSALHTHSCSNPAESCRYGRPQAALLSPTLSGNPFPYPGPAALIALLPAGASNIELAVCNGRPKSGKSYHDTPSLRFGGLSPIMATGARFCMA